MKKRTLDTKSAATLGRKFQGKMVEVEGYNQTQK